MSIPYPRPNYSPLDVQFSLSYFRCDCTQELHLFMWTFERGFKFQVLIESALLKKWQKSLPKKLYQNAEQSDKPYSNS